MRARVFDQRLKAEGIPLEISNLGSIWVVCHTIKCRYHWMLQFYLRAEGLALSWTGSGRLIFSLNYTDDDFAAATERFVAAAKAMREDGWWWENPDVPPRRPSSARWCARCCAGSSGWRAGQLRHARTCSEHPARCQYCDFA